MRTLLLTSALCLVPNLNAQTAVPEDRPHVLIDTFGPDGWRSRLGPTNLGSLLESEEGRLLWQPHVQPMLELWQQLAGGADGDQAIERLHGYGGRIRAAIWLDPEGGPSQPASCIALVLDRDPRSDLGPIKDDLERALYTGLKGEWSDVEIDGETRRVRVGEDMDVTAPFFVGDNLFLAASADGELATAVRRAKLMSESGPAARPDAPALRIRLGLGALVAQAFEAGAGSDETWMEAFGFRSLGDLTFTISSAGPRVRAELSQQFTQEERGLFAALLPSTPTVPSLLGATPPEGSWTVGHFDLLKLYDVLVTAIDSDRRGRDTTTREDIVEELGMDPGPELLAHMTDEVILALHDREDLVDHPGRLPWTIAWRLSDAAAFEKGLNALLPNFKPFFSRERTEQHGDFTLHRYGNLTAYDQWLAVGAGVFAIGGGWDSEQYLVALLERCARVQPEPLAANTHPEGFRRLKRHLLPHAHGYSSFRTTMLARMPMTFWLEVVESFLPIPLPQGPQLSPDEEAERGEALAELLERHNLHVTRSATGWGDGTWTWQLFW